ncbi:MAG TPA: glycine zipper domain-containing protein [Planctomicrobium sp.]|nr:glycine zipper domain-containing protein [Planctomicrobium sp.]
MKFVIHRERPFFGSCFPFYLLAFAALGFPGCAHMNHAESGSLVGAAFGSLAGAAIGSDSGNAGAGALIGGVTGAIAGNIIGDAEDAREQRDQAQFERDSVIANASYQASQQPALNNFDLIRLTQSGVSDDVVVNMIHTQGGQFDLGTDAIITLKSNGVSDRVIVAAQQAPNAPPKPGVVIVKQQPAVILEPAPVVVGGWWGPHYRYRPHYHPYHHPRHRSSVGVSFGF